MASFLPILFTWFGWEQTQGLVRSIEIKAEYLKLIEGAMPRLGTLTGWETWWHGKRGTKPHKQDWNLWKTMLVLTVAGSVAYIVLSLVPRADSSERSATRSAADTAVVPRPAQP